MDWADMFSALAAASRQIVIIFFIELFLYKFVILFLELTHQGLGFVIADSTGLAVYCIYVPSFLDYFFNVLIIESNS